MKQKTWAGLAAGLLLAVYSVPFSVPFSVPMFGHHNTLTKYDADHPVTVSGTVKRFRMVNPHGRIEVEVKEESGAVALWDIESGSASGLYRRGWRTDDLKPGDRVTATGSPALDGSKSMVLIKLVTPSGKVLE